MGRVKLKFPNEKPLFKAIIPVRISDINYGNHLGNDSLLSIIHESRMQMLAQWGYNELSAGGTSLIMADVMIAYKSEAFYGEILEVKIYAEEITDRSFDLLYRIETLRDERPTDVAHAKTGMICFDYKERRIDMITQDLKNHLLEMNF